MDEFERYLFGFEKAIKTSRRKTPRSYLYASLHYKRPTRFQNEFEMGYEGYRRIPIARSARSWPQKNGSFYNRKPITFAEVIKAGTRMHARYFAIGWESKDRGNIVWSGRLKSTLKLSAGKRPRLTKIRISSED